MRSLGILLGMIACLFVPSAIFTVIGYKSMMILSKRPTNSAKVMIALITRLVIVSSILMGILTIMLKTLAPKG